MPSIYTLISDVKAFLLSQQEFEIPITVRYGERRDPPTLRLSKMGPICPKHLWYSIHHPEMAEPLPAEAIFKFSFGHTIEAQALALARVAGHDVRGEQDELVVDGIKGHRDCVLDGYIVDVKSCSSRMYEKFQTGSLKYDDPFGYLEQLDGYMVGSADDDLVRVKDTAFIWAIDKTLGKMCLYEHTLRSDSIHARIRLHKSIVARSISPECTCEVVPDGKSGNIKLGVKASYSPFKHCCFPNVRTFLYASGPVFLTKVMRVPDVPELNLRPVQYRERLLEPA